MQKDAAKLFCYHFAAEKIISNSQIMFIVWGLPLVLYDISSCDAYKDKACKTIIATSQQETPLWLVIRRKMQA